MAALSPAGCGSSAKVHPGYAALSPRTIAVHPVINETVHQLDEVAIGGLLQRLSIGPDVHDVPEILRASLEEALLLKGYSTAPYQAPPGEPAERFPPPRAPGADGGPPSPLPPVWGNLPFQAVLVPVIEAWQATRVHSPAISMKYRLALYRLPDAEVLYSGTFESGYREDIRSRTADEIPAWIRRSARRAIASLPPAGP